MKFFKDNIASSQEMENSFEKKTATLSLNSSNLLQSEPEISPLPFHFFQTESLTRNSLIPNFLASPPVDKPETSLEMALSNTEHDESGSFVGLVIFVLSQLLE